MEVAGQTKPGGLNNTCPAIVKRGMPLFPIAGYRSRRVGCSKGGKTPTMTA